MDGPPGEATILLQQMKQGQPDAADQLIPLVYHELRRIAGAYMRDERAGHTLQPTALVHEAWLRLIDQTRVDWQDRAHFVGVAATMMRRILVDYARARLANKRGRGEAPLDLDRVDAAVNPEKLDEVLTIDEALTRLEQIDPKLADVVEMRYFAGMSSKETAAALGVSTRTVDRDWRLARVWLSRELSREAAG